MKRYASLLLLGTLASAIGGALAAPTGPAAPAASPKVQAFLDVLNSAGGKPMEQLTPQQARKVLVDAQAGATLPAAEVTRKTITVDGKPLGLVVVKPPGSAGKTLPVFMFFHGGGWVLGDFPTHERLIRDLVQASGAAAVYVDYSPSPEARYPVAIHQAYAATKWVAAHGAEIGVDGTRLALVGNSVGGNMAASVALQAKAAGTPAIRYEVLLWPVTDAAFDNGSYQQFQQGYFLSRNMMRWFWDSYITDPAQRREIYASPLQASVEQLKGLPPTLIQTAELDVLRDEGEAYGRKLDQAGVEVTVTRYNGLIHDYGLLNALSDVPAVRTAIRQAGDALQQHLAD
ncbi:alpha/beta hydrolase [Xanthomonas campestris]|uniref:alpha/beta hydrolase n=1 Tax=Xanthomonas campestris TaxID=339 RepID=UPI0023681061|nr:alpha/beta hydrolase [Xanthomonas campestris]MCW1979848.1 acetyl esterase/lipase [Xanthomonas campestris]WDI93465.1 alpha/beta hydrolase [Xanthomonas campestris]